MYFHSVLDQPHWFPASPISFLKASTAFEAQAQLAATPAPPWPEFSTQMKPSGPFLEAPMLNPSFLMGRSVFQLSHPSPDSKDSVSPNRLWHTPSQSLTVSRVWFGPAGKKSWHVRWNRFLLSLQSQSSKFYLSERLKKYPEYLNLTQSIWFCYSIILISQAIWHSQSGQVIQWIILSLTQSIWPY